MYIDTSTNFTISQNLFYDLSKGWAIQLYPGTSTNLHVAGNTFIGANPWRDGQILIYAGLTNAIFENNTFHAPKSYAISYGGGTMQNVVIRNNDSYPAPVTAGGWPSGVAISGNANTDPGAFVPQNWTP